MVLIAVGVMNVVIMAALAVVIFAEKLWRYGKPFGQAVGVALAVFGVLAIWFPRLLPGLHMSPDGPHGWRCKTGDTGTSRILQGIE